MDDVQRKLHSSISSCGSATWTIAAQAQGQILARLAEWWNKETPSVGASLGRARYSRAYLLSNRAGAIDNYGIDGANAV